MKRWAIAAAAAVVMVGCVSKADHEAVVAQLEECRTDKTAAQEATRACDERFDREIARFDSMDETIEQVIPDTMAEFENERERILELVPAQVQEEVAAYVDEFSVAMTRGFQVLQSDNQRMVLELNAAKTELERLGANTEGLLTQVDTLSSSIDTQGATRRQVESIAAMIRHFDSTMINCRDCKDRLRLNRREREEISNFHAQLMEALTDLQAGGTEEDRSGVDLPEDEPVLEAEPEDG